jgi:exosome complex component RRP4
VVPVKTAYMPRPGDLVVGYIEGMRANIWFIDIGAPFNAILPMSLAPGKVDYGATRDAMDVGTTILCRVQEVDESHSSVVTMKGMGLRKLNSGFVDQVPPHLNAQIIGSKGSMIQMLKEASDCRIIVGQNGRLWIEGEPEGVRLVRDALKMIRETGHAPGLAGRVQSLLDS